jgi:hypothetical protein
VIRPSSALSARANFALRLLDIGDALQVACEEDDVEAAILEWYASAASRSIRS